MRGLYGRRRTEDCGSSSYRSLQRRDARFKINITWICDKSKKTYQNVVRKHAMKPVYVNRWDGQGEIKSRAGATTTVGSVKTDGSSRRIRSVGGGGSCFLLPFLLGRGLCTATTTFGGGLIQFGSSWRERDLDLLRRSIAFAFCSSNRRRGLLYKITDMNYVDNTGTYGRNFGGHAIRGRE